MEAFVAPRPHPRRIPPLDEDGSLRRRSTGHDLKALTDYLAKDKPRAFLAASNRKQTVQGLLQLLPEAIGTAVVVLDAKRDPKTGQFGVVSASTCTHKMGIALHHLMKESGLRLNQLPAGPLAQIFSWIANGSILTVVANRKRWMDFMKASGREQGRVKGLLDALTLARQAVADGRLELPPGAHLTDENAVAFLCQGYLGQYHGPVTAKDYDKSFPGLPRPPYRRAELLHDWPGSRSCSPESFTLHQVRNLQEEPRGILMATFDLIRVNMPPDAKDYKSRELARVNKGSVLAGLGECARRQCDLEVDRVQDEGVLTMMTRDEMEDIDRRRDRTSSFFGDNQYPPLEGLDLYPGTSFKDGLLKGYCPYCGFKHDGEDDRCELAKRGSARRIAEDEYNCDYCLMHDHWTRACPTLHFRCQECGRLGHLTINCDMMSPEEHLDAFLANCRVGLWTRLEQRGPLGGPFGFGLGLDIVIPPAQQRRMEELRMLNERRFLAATEEERNERDVAVQLVLEETPLLNMIYLPEKTFDEPWHRYWNRLNFRVRGSDHGRALPRT